MSGGVDSSVAAKRLIERGYEIIGVFIKVWQPDFIHCDWEKERLDAMRVAAHLSIPFLTMNAEDVYKREVADYMIRSYEAGITPNPDVMCNEHVKFGVFYEWARAHGGDFVATGHYAQVRRTAESTELHRGIDPKKDQSYFLWKIPRATLENVLFPIGDTSKIDIRKEAELARIPTAKKSDSQGICFLGHIDMYEFLSHYITLTPGAVIDRNGTIVGEHRGAHIYTTGQRHGFTITHTTTELPHYVIARDLEKNTITVDTTVQPPSSSQIVLTSINEIGNGFVNSMEAEFRYHSTPVEVTYTKTARGDGILKSKETLAESPTRGQSCVLYRGTECCGGGIIA